MDDHMEGYLPVRCRLRLKALDERMTHVEPSTLLLVDRRRRMLCLRFGPTGDLYDLTDFALSEDEEFVTFDRDEYTRLLFWLREEYNTLNTAEE